MQIIHQWKEIQRWYSQIMRKDGAMLKDMCNMKEKAIEGCYTTY